MREPHGGKFRGGEEYDTGVVLDPPIKLLQSVLGHTIGMSIAQLLGWKHLPHSTGEGFAGVAAAETQAIR